MSQESSYSTCRKTAAKSLQPTNAYQLQRIDVHPDGQNELRLYQANKNADTEYSRGWHRELTEGSRHNQGEHTHTMKNYVHQASTRPELSRAGFRSGDVLETHAACSKPPESPSRGLPQTQEQSSDQSLSPACQCALAGTGIQALGAPRAPLASPGIEQVFFQMPSTAAATLRDTFESHTTYTLADVAGEIVYNQEALHQRDDTSIRQVSRVPEGPQFIDDVQPFLELAQAPLNRIRDLVRDLQQELKRSRTETMSLRRDAARMMIEIESLTEVKVGIEESKKVLETELSKTALEHAQGQDRLMARINQLEEHLLAIQAISTNIVLSY